MSLNVLHLVESLAPEAGSAALSLQGLWDALRGSNVATEVLAVGSDPSRPSTDRRNGDLGSHLQPADVVHIHGWGSPSLREAARIVRRLGKPYLLSPLGGIDGRRRARPSWGELLRAWRYDRQLLRGAAAIACQNEYERNALKSRSFGGKLVVLPYGITVADYEDPPGPLPDPVASKNGRMLLVLGPLHPIEGLVPLLKSLAELGPLSDGWSVVLAGREVDEWWRMLEPAIRRKGGEGRVIRADAEDVVQQRTWLARASVLAAPSLTARCPVSVLQAMAAGVPVLATTCVAPPGAETAIRVCRPLRTELTRSLRELLSADDAQRADSASRARELVRSRNDWSVLAPRYLELYRRIGGDTGA